MSLKVQTVARASSQVSSWVILLILVIGSFFSTFIPPFQSPDEFAHIERAYLLSNGTIIMDTPEGKATGGMIDSGLSNYMKVYDVLPFKPDRKLSSEEIEYAKTIQWTGIKNFAEIPGVSFYFPLIYLPQAIGLSAGEVLRLPIHTSYLLARFIALASIAVILFAAFKMYPVSPLAIGLLIMPMSVFQFSSASLDGVSTALAVFSIATFLRIADEKTEASPWLFYAHVLSVVLVTTCRAHLLPLLALVLMSCFYTKKKRFFYICGFSVLFVLAWTVIASKTTVGFESRVGAPTSNVALFYIKNPIAFFDVLIATLSNSDLIRFYRDSFLGILGWLDSRFSTKIYKLLFICITIIGFLSVSVENLKYNKTPRLIVFLSALASFFLIFFALLITWNKHPANVIEGVQGRYFLVPMIMVAYAVSGELKFLTGIYRKIALVFVVFLGGITIFSTPPLLIDRYFLAPEQSEQISRVTQASVPLDKNNPITLFMRKNHETDLRPLKRIGIMFGTYMRKNPGSAELRLNSPDGHTLDLPFDLLDLADNQYKYFEVDSMPYSSGQIKSLTGVGVSVWEVHEDKGAVMTCMVFEYSNGAKRYTQGCPKPSFD